MFRITVPLDDEYSFDYGSITGNRSAIEKNDKTVYEYTNKVRDILSFMPYADRIHLTRIDYVYEADTFFPEISPNEWSLTDVSDEQTYFDLIYDFRCYERKQK